MAIKVPYGSTGNLQAITPIRDSIASSPLSATAVSAVSEVLTSDAFYIYSTVPIHVRIGGTPCTTTEDFPIPANIPLVFACTIGDVISIIKQAGVSDGLTYIHALQTS